MSAASNNGSNVTSQQLYQQLLTCLRGEWHSMVVVPASPGSSAAMVANALVEVSTLVRGKKARLFSTEGLGVNDVSKVIVDMMQHIGTGGLAIASIDSVINAQSGIPMTLAVDVEAGVTYWLVVDHPGQPGGSFLLDVTFR
jgi:hypothetical protein